MHGSVGDDSPASGVTARVCRLPGCERSFEAKRKNQSFCTPECRGRFFELARRIGVGLLEAKHQGQAWAVEALRRIEDESPDGQDREK
jgi:uncharacterized ferredoxin-like protein